MLDAGLVMALPRPSADMMLDYVQWEIASQGLYSLSNIAFECKTCEDRSCAI